MTYSIETTTSIDRDGHDIDPPKMIDVLGVFRDELFSQRHKASGFSPVYGFLGGSARAASPSLDFDKDEFVAVERN